MNTPVQAPQSAPANLVTARPTNSETAPEPSNSFQQVLAQQVKNKSANDKGNTGTAQAAPGQGNKAQNANAKQAQEAQGPSSKPARNVAFKDVDALVEDGKSGKIRPETKDLAQEDEKDVSQAAAAIDTSALVVPVMQMSNVPAEATAQPVAGNEDAVAELTAQPQRGKLDDALSKILSEGKSGAGSEKTAVSAAEEDNGTDLAAWIDRMLPKSKAGEGIASALSDKAKGETSLERLQPAKAQDVIQTLSQVQTSAHQPSPVQEASALGSSNAINAYPGRAGWDQAIGQKVVWMAGNGEQTATLTLNPPELGPLQVVIHVHNDQADASFMSNNQEVRQALQDGMDNLRQMMNASGIQLGQTNVGAHTQPQQSSAQANPSAGGNRPQTAEQDEAAASAISNTRTIRSSNGLVDTFV